ncbi:hypothetical protein [Tautonia plasticadhaerens]|uniref:Uncharacterized protein n=1 Tax=Tautonia plasticadhaerens TaxID=2527974 RepID=A0A518GWM7_9BACT|nr:hypothetical protein [Tautonia plasticadhaerens]QDV33000.1 hypothetical protein ElP_08420 [Tautonia plasticadhaerens]
MSLVLSLAIAIGPTPPPPPQRGAPEVEVIHARFEVDLIGRSRAVFALPAGPRVIKRFRWVPDPDSPGPAWRAARLRIAWEGDDPEGAAVDLPLGRFVEPVEGRRDDPDGPVLANERPMPYRERARLVLDAEGPIRGSFRIDSGPVGPALQDRGYLHAEVVGEGGGPGPNPPPGEIGREGPGVSTPAVRYWYDRRPGPAPEAARGR